MSKNELNKYKDTYSRFLATLLDYHNRHTDFINRTRRMSAIELRTQTREIRKVAKELYYDVWSAYEEYHQNQKERLAEEKAEKEARKLKRKNNGNNKSIKDNV